MAAEGIIILAHGSKRKSTNRVAKVFRQIVSAAFPGKLVEAAYLQLSKPTLERSVEKLNLVGVTKITIVPLFLFDGVHVTRDIPSLIAAVENCYPQIEFILTSHLGADRRIAEILIDRISSAELR